MKIFELKEMVRGWFVGGFDPTVYKTTDVEVAIQKFSKGTYEKSHHHKIATEITVLISGSAIMKDSQINEGDIVVIEPGESTSFKALEDTINVVVKIPGALNDKYLD